MRILQTLHKLLRARRNKDTFIFILFFALVSIVWYGHSMQSVHSTRVDVAIRYIGKPARIGLGDEGLPDHMTVELRDAGHRLVQYHQQPMQITINLHQYIHSDSGMIQIPSNVLRGSVKSLLQANTTLVETWPEEIQCSYFREHEKKVVLMLDADIVPASDYLIVGKPKIKKNKITIYGQKELLSTIDTIRTQHVTITNVRDTLRQNLAIAFPHGVRAGSDSVQLEVMTEQFVERKFDVPVIAANLSSNAIAHFFPSSVEVTVRIGPKYEESLKLSDLHVYCTVPKVPRKKLSVEINYSANPHILSAWLYPGEVEYFVEEKEMKAKEE